MQLDNDTRQEENANFRPRPNLPKQRKIYDLDVKCCDSSGRSIDMTLHFCSGMRTKLQMHIHLCSPLFLYMQKEHT